MALKPRIQKFIDEYIIDGNATEAAKRAGFSPASAHGQGSRLLKNPEVKFEIEKRYDKLERKALKRAAYRGITKERWMRELEIIAFANMDDYVKISDYNIGQGTDGKPLVRTAAFAVNTKDRRRALGRAIKKISETKNGIGIELHSKQAALETLGKAYGWLKDTTVFENQNGESPAVVLMLPQNGSEAKQVKNKKDDSGNDDRET